MLRNKFENSINMLKKTSLSKLKMLMKKHIYKDKKIHSLIDKIPTNDKCLQENIKKLCSNTKYKNMIFNVVKSKLMEGAKSPTRSKSRTPSRSKNKTKSKRTPSRSKNKTKSKRTPSRSKNKTRSNKKITAVNSRGSKNKKGGDVQLRIHVLFMLFLAIFGTYTITNEINENRLNTMSRTCSRAISMREVEVYENIFKYPSPPTIQTCKNVLENNNYRVTRRNRQSSKKSNSWWNM